jgi:two-component system cell cycle sensor histidine kinase/response regulator CckA
MPVPGEGPPSPANPPRILLIEDDDADAELILAELRRTGVACIGRRVQTEAALREALARFVPDVVLSDHSLPGFSGQEALRIVRAECPTTPFVIVTGSLNEETAAEYIKAGAVDYVVKDRLFRLGSAVQGALALRRALEEAARAEAARTRSEQRFRKLVEYSSDVITLVDGAGRIVYSTQALKPTLGYGQGELTGRDVFELVHPDDHPQALALFQAVLASRERVVRSALRVRHKEGTWRNLEVVGANHLGDPVVEAVVVNYHDVTDRTRAEAALRQLEEQHRQAQKMEAIGRLASGVAHDFNNVLTVITTCCEFLLELPADAAIRAEALEIRQAADRAARLTHQLLAFSRQQPVSRQRVDWNALVANMTGMLHRILGGTVSASFVPTAAPTTVWADPGHLEQVIMNLAVNARDAMPDGGRLTLATHVVEVDEAQAAAHGAHPGPYVVLSVSDTGTGMDDYTKAHLFEPFFTTKAKGEGTGLGLATVYGIVQQAGGFIDVDSAVGKGSTFRVYLPRDARG